MNKIKTMELVYESLIPVADPDNMFLSVGTVTLASDHELNLDFNCTSTSWQLKPDAYVELHTTLSEFEPHTYEDDYARLGLTANDLTYDYFADLLTDTYVTEVYTEYVSCSSEHYLPVTLKSIQLHFTDGHFLDYSSRISVFALAQLAEMM